MHRVGMEHQARRCASQETRLKGASVEWVSDDRMPDVGEVASDLVPGTAADAHTDQSVFFELGDASVVCAALAPASNPPTPGTGRNPDAGAPPTAGDNGEIDLAPLLLEPSMDEGHVFLEHRAFAVLHAQILERELGARCKHDP